jgi:hypothetical protein
MNQQESTPRQSLSHWATDRGHPALRFRALPERGEDEWIDAGSSSWERFLATASDIELALAVEAARRRDDR